MGSSAQEKGLALARSMDSSSVAAKEAECRWERGVEMAESGNAVQLASTFSVEEEASAESERGLTQ